MREVFIVGAGGHARVIASMLKAPPQFVTTDPARDEGNGKDGKSKTKPAKPPGIQFRWGSFVFAGTLDSMEETLDYFGEDGTAMRSTVSLSITRTMSACAAAP